MINPILNHFDNIVFFIPKEIIEKKDYSFVLSKMDELSKDEFSIRKFKNAISLGFDGYDSDQREVYEIIEIRSYINQVTNEFPYWFYFFNLNDHSLWIIMLALCRYEKSGPGKAEINKVDFGRMMAFLFNKLNSFYLEHGLAESELDILSKQIGDYFENRNF